MGKRSARGGRALAAAVLLVAAAAVLGIGCSDTGGPDDGAPADTSGALLADHEALGAFPAIPAAVLEQIRADFSIYYGHTSHGSQIVTGLQMLADEDPDYELPAIHEVSDDLGLQGDTSWADVTRTFLNAHPRAYNVVVWSWCGGCSDNTVAGIQAYLDTMNGLERDFPDVAFVYMTGHLDGTGEDGNLFARNNQIRAWCTAHGKILFDFADIETWDPAGAYHPDASDACEWCTTWCLGHPCPTCDSCAHSHCFNCYLKGKAFWWMMARMAGWGNQAGGRAAAGDRDEHR
jgi:hypothetical protein